MSKIYKLNIKDVKWTFQCLQDADYDHEVGTDSDGASYTEFNEIFVRRPALSKGLILHELLHAYVSSCCIESTTELSSKDMEEICAEILRVHGESMYKVTNRLYRSIIKELPNKNG